MRPMTRPLSLAPLLALLALAGGSHAQQPALPDAQAFLGQSLARIRSNDLVRSRHTFTEKETRCTYDSSGRVVRKQIRIYDFSGEAWVDEADHELVRLKVDCLDTVSVKFGFIFRLLKGSRGFIERRQIDGDAWLPIYSRFTGSGRVFFVARIDLDQESEYSAYTRKDDER
jgi:hypothetical protein